MPEVNNETILLIFVALTGLAVLMQAFILLALFFSVRKMTTSMDDLMVSWKKTAAEISPVAEGFQRMLKRVEPQIAMTVDNLRHVSEDVRRQSANVNATATEFIECMRHQGQRLDDMLTNTLDSVDHARALIYNAVTLPVRQVNGIVAAARAIGKTLSGAGRPRSSTRTSFTASMRTGAYAAPSRGTNEDGDIFI